MTPMRKGLHLITLVALLLVPGTIDAAGQKSGEPKPAGKHAKLDKALRKALETGDRGNQRVIIRTKKGSRASVRYALEVYGDEIKGEHPSIDGVTAVVAADVLEILENSSLIESVSIDAVVHALQTSGGSLDMGTGVANHLRSTLGLTPSSNGISEAPSCLRTSSSFDSLRPPRAQRRAPPRPYRASRYSATS